MKYYKDWSTVMVQLTEYFETIKVPKTINAALKDLKIGSTNRTRIVKILREEFPDEMKALDQMHYCIPASSKGSIISGYFFVKYHGEFIRYIGEDMSMDKIYDILMQDPRNKHLGITKKKFMKDVYAHVEAGSDPEIKKVHNERMSKKRKRLDDLFKDVMTSRPYKYTVATICEKYDLDKATLYTILKHVKNGKDLKERLDYREYVNCTARAEIIKAIKSMELDGTSMKEIAEKFGVTESYVKYTAMAVERLNEKISKAQVQV